jgi:hypothetical protein
VIGGEVGGNFYDAKVKVLSEKIGHHVKEEEGGNGIFSQAKKAGIDMAALGEHLAARTAELKTLFRASGVPRPETRSMKGAKVAIGKPF